MTTTDRLLVLLIQATAASARANVRAVEMAEKNLRHNAQYPGDLPYYSFTQFEEALESERLDAETIEAKIDEALVGDNVVTITEDRSFEQQPGHTN